MEVKLLQSDIGDCKHAVTCWMSKQAAYCQARIPESREGSNTDYTLSVIARTCQKEE